MTNPGGTKRRSSRGRDVLPPPETQEEKPLSPDQAALQVLIARIEELEKTTRLQAAQFQAAVEEKESEFKSQLYAMEEEKRQAQEGLRAAIEAREKALANAPKLDPATVQAMLGQMQVDARKIHDAKREHFKEVLATCPRGTVLNSQGGWVFLQVNGVVHWLKPGKNENVPQPFIEAYNALLESKADAEVHAMFFQAHPEYNKAEDQLAIGRGSLGPTGRAWSEE